MLTTPMENSPPRRPIRTDDSNRFAHHTMTVRLPAVIDAILEANPDYPEPTRDSLSRLKVELLDDRPLRSIVPPAPDWEVWEERIERHRGESWLHAEWFFAEHLFYRRIIEAVRWWETGRDPFAPMKSAEYASEGFTALLAAAGEILDPEGALEEQITRALVFDLWGNRIDLSHRSAAALGAHGVASEELMVDDREGITRKLEASRGTSRPIIVVTDNTGSELAMDLLLANLFTRLGLAVEFHVKMHPTYVSDAIAADIHSLIRRLREEPSATSARAAGERLEAAFRSGSLRIVPDPFWNSSAFVGELPPRLERAFAEAALVIFKGDLNYRRFSGDLLWPPEAGFSEVVGSFPAPVALLRTMKSDTIFGLPPGVAERLEAEDPEWRTNGRRGVIQYFS